MAAKRGRPFSQWRDWEGRTGTVHEMCAWHGVTRAALYQRKEPTPMADGRWYLPAPKRGRAGNNA